ncbi:L-aspartate oxidase [Corynebacterium alimapuense]|uniref:L-aspartate oxidase n=2 Tax=Corynebacterium alimapuense TaxID=1576874 RepID=A0A3M8K9C7_9CORY|nr:L-aspartate oxidase [Corynebacterium alimapuense]
MTSMLATAEPSWRRETSVIIIGSGAAGLAAAVRLADAQVPAVVLTRATEPGESATDWAQGGLAAVFDAEDSANSHVVDTLIAGAGLCEPAAVRTLVDAAPQVIGRLIELGADFDRTIDGVGFDLHLEGGHSARRILHARGDGSGHEVEKTLVDTLRSRLDRSGCSVRLRTGLRAIDVLTDVHGHAAGIRVRDSAGHIGELLAPSVVLATGGAGQAWTLTSNPSVATGDGLAMAWRAGAVLRDLEFVQFHPTVLHVPRSGGRDVLVSEAVRGEGAILIDHAGEPVMAGVHPLADLAPRDVVASTMYARMLASGEDCLLLDARHFGQQMWETKFPGILQLLRERGVDPVVDPIPVRPGAHYFCGGVAADMDGVTGVPGLYAIGEVASTGVQGANRLASNSMPEALVMGDRLGGKLANFGPGPSPVPITRPTSPIIASSARAQINEIMDVKVGVLRDAGRLGEAINELAELPVVSEADPGACDEDCLDATALATVGSLIARAALERTESRGAHRRADYPESSANWEVHLCLIGGVGGHVQTVREPIGEDMSAVV